MARGTSNTRIKNVTNVNAYGFVSYVRKLVLLAMDWKILVVVPCVYE